MFFETVPSHHCFLGPDLVLAGTVRLCGRVTALRRACFGTAGKMETGLRSITRRSRVAGLKRAAPDASSVN